MVLYLFIRPYYAHFTLQQDALVMIAMHIAAKARSPLE